MITTAERDAYLARLGLEPEPPSAEALARIHRAHVERVPYETLWIHLGERWTIGLAESVTRIATGGRGGYCYHLNGALSELLRALGYEVTRHLGCVHGPEGAAADGLSNHLVLMAHGLPTDANPGGDWYVDVGLGDALHEPLPLVAGEYRQGPFGFALAATPGAVGDWQMTHDPAGSFTGMAWRLPEAGMEAFAERHTELSTSPDSGFVRTLTVQRRDATGVDILRGLTLKRTGDGEASPPTTLASEAELTDVLTDVFGLDLIPVTAEARHTLWATTHASHQSWEASLERPDVQESDAGLDPSPALAATFGAAPDASAPSRDEWGPG